MLEAAVVELVWPLLCCATASSAFGDVYGFGGLARVERRGVPELMYCEIECYKPGFIAKRSTE